MAPTLPQHDRFHERCGGSQRLRNASALSRERIANPDNVVAVSAASAWEISIKRTLGKLAAPDDLEKQLKATGFVSLPITMADGIAAGQLPRHHDDPFDRMLVAQAQARGMMVATRNLRMSAYGVDLLLA